MSISLRMRMRVQWLVVCLMAGVAGQITAVGQAADEPDKIARDADGDPLPPHAILRLGTARWRHPGRMQSLHWSPDGKTVLVHSPDDETLTLDGTTGRLIRKLKLSTWEFGLSPDGKELACRMAGGVVGLDPVTGKQLRTYPGAGWWMFHYSPSGKYLVSATQEDYDVIDRATGEMVVTCKTNSVIKGFAFSPDESLLYVASYAPSVAVLDLKKKSLARKWNDDDEHFVHGPAVSPDGKLFAVANVDIAVVDAATGETQFRLASDDDKESFAHLTFRGKQLVAATQNGSVYIWDVAEQKRLTKLEATGGILGVRNMRLSPDGKQLALADYSSRIWIWDLEQGKLLHDVPGHAWPIQSVAFSPDGALIATGSDRKETQLWKAATGKHVASLPARSSALLTFANKGESLLTFRGNQREISTWKWETPPVEQKLPFAEETDPEAYVRVFLSSDQKRMLRLIEVFEKKLWSMDVVEYPTLKPLANAKVGAISRSGAITADGRLVAFGRENDVQLYDVDANKVVGTLKGHTVYPEAMAFTPDGRLLLSVSCDRTLRVWNVAERKLAHVPEGQGRTVAAVAISPNGRVAATCGTDTCREPCERPNEPRQILFWDIEAGEQLACYRGHDVDGQALAFSPDGKRLASGLNDGTTIVWETPELAWK